MLELNKKILINAKNGDKESLEQVIQNNLKFIYKLASQAREGDSNLEFDDLVSQGVIGILKALKNYDTNKDIKFLTYAYHYIKNSILDYSNRNHFSVKLSDSKIREYVKLNSQKQSKNKAKLDKFKLFKRNNTISFEKVKFDEFNHNNTVPLERIKVNSNSYSGTSFDIIENKIYLEKLLEKSNLSNLELRILKEIYYNQLSIKHASLKLDLDPLKVKKIKNVALNKLRAASSAKSYFEEGMC